MQGRIIRGIAGFYYVDVVESGIYECKAKGIFRKEKKKPLVGDIVEIEIIQVDEHVGSVMQIHERKNELIRPAIANVDQALVVFAVTEPSPHLNLLNKFLVMMESKKIPVLLCFNKQDLASQKQIKQLEAIYRNSGYPLLFTSAEEESNIEGIKNKLIGKMTVVAGPSGVGKSSLINCLQQNVYMETGAISQKIARGKHTTRHAELITVDKDSYIADTPGFTSLYVEDFKKEDLKYYYHEFIPYNGQCKFLSCSHIHEPGCTVRKAVEEGDIHEQRYKSYLEIYKEVEGKKRY